MTNIDKLWAKMEERCISKNELAEGIGIDRSTLYRKAGKGLDGFSCQEMRNIGLFLRLTIAEMNDIFLSDYPIV